VLENGDTTMAKTNRTITRGDALAALAAGYRRSVEDLAERLRPRFEAGELYGWGRPDREDPDDHHCEKHPLCLLENEVKATIPDFPTAYLILACSPAEAADIDGEIQLDGAKLAAAECMVIDAYRVARERGWWKPRCGEWVGQAESPALSGRRASA
jgi:hypothetical protein